MEKNEHAIGHFPIEFQLLRSLCVSLTHTLIQTGSLAKKKLKIPCESIIFE